MSFTSSNQLEQGDAFYAELIKAHEGLSAAESEALNARLILLMANQIGQHDALMECLWAAKK